MEEVKRWKKVREKQIDTDRYTDIMINRHTVTEALNQKEKRKAERLIWR